MPTKFGSVIATDAETAAPVGLRSSIVSTAIGIPLASASAGTSGLNAFR